MKTTTNSHIKLCGTWKRWRKRWCWRWFYLALGLKMMLAMIMIVEMMIMIVEAPSPRHPGWIFWRWWWCWMLSPSARQPRRSGRRPRWSRRGTRRVLRSKLSQLGIGNIFIFIHPTYYFLALYSLYSWDLKHFHTFSKAFPYNCKIAQVGDTLWGFFKIEISNCNLSEIQLPKFATFFGKKKV